MRLWITWYVMNRSNSGVCTEYVYQQDCMICIEDSMYGECMYCNGTLCNINIPTPITVLLYYNTNTPCPIMFPCQTALSLQGYGF